MATLEYVTEQPISEADDLPEQLRVRRDKRERMLAEGVEPYPVGFPLTTTLGELRRKYADLATDTATATPSGWLAG